MKFENLKEKIVIKNYKELCSLLEIKVMSGKSKKIQLEDLERFCEYHKEGNKFVIDEIFETPLPKVDGRINGNNNVYVEEIGDILVEYISNNKKADNKVLLSFSKLINILGLVNNTYTVGNYRKKELSDILKIELSAIHYFYNTSRCEFKKIIKRALNNLQKRSVIKYEEKWQICENIKVDGETRDSYRLATENEISMILNAQKRSLKEMELKDLTALFLAGSGKYREFNKKVNDKLPNSWNYYYSVYEIIYGSAAVDIEMEYIEEKRVSLNNKSKDKMSKVFGIDEEESNEKRLTEVLIDLIKYDLKLDEQIIKKYEENRENKNKLIEEEQKKVIKLEKVRNKIEKKQNNLIENIVSIEDNFSNRDSIEEYEYFNYKDNINNRKKTNEFCRDLDEVLETI
ncbi:hypothetical protein SNUCP2_17440 [Clostridium perfringens A]|uniref:hypothetical protein n=1 Tax=Clostridium perfringens TaxID=1502 RepID=UPI00399CC013